MVYQSRKILESKELRLIQKHSNYNSKRQQLMTMAIGLSLLVTHMVRCPNSSNLPLKCFPSLNKNCLTLKEMKENRSYSNAKSIANLDQKLNGLKVTKTSPRIPELKFTPTLMAKIVLQSTAPQEVWQEIMNVEQQMKWEQQAANAQSKLTPNQSAMIWMTKKPLKAMTLPSKLTAMVTQNPLQNGQKMEKESIPRMVILPLHKPIPINTGLLSRE